MGAFKYGFVRGYRNIVQMPAAASIALLNSAGGKFVYSASGYATKVTGNVDIFGWAEHGNTGSATAGVTVLNVDVSTESLYRIRVDAEKTEAELIALVGLCADIVVATGVQYVDVGASSYKHVLVCGYEYSAAVQYCLVKICAARQQNTAIT